MMITNATSGKVLKQNCSAITESKMPPPALITAAWNFKIKPSLKKIAQCGGNDGSYDTWNIDVVHHKSDPSPIPGVKLPPADVVLNLSTQMDEKYLVHAETMNMSLHTDKTASGAGPVDEKASATIKVSQSSSTGPTADDLDYSGWGKCTPIHPADHTFLSDLAAFKLLPGMPRTSSRSSIANLMMLLL